MSRKNRVQVYVSSEAKEVFEKERGEIESYLKRIGFPGELTTFSRFVGYLAELGLAKRPWMEEVEVRTVGGGVSRVLVPSSAGREGLVERELGLESGNWAESLDFALPRNHMLEALIEEEEAREDAEDGDGEMGPEGEEDDIEY